MNIEEILKAWLKENGYDGLCNPVDECGCGLDDFMPCGDPNISDCEAAHAEKKDGVDFYLPGPSTRLRPPGK